MLALPFHARPLVDIQSGRSSAIVPPVATVVSQMPLMFTKFDAIDAIFRSPTPRCKANQRDPADMPLIHPAIAGIATSSLGLPNDLDHTALLQAEILRHRIAGLNAW
jgi:hypothetical protein